MPSNNIRQFIDITFDDVLCESNNTEYEYEETSEEEIEESSIKELLYELENISDMWKWHRELNENKNYNKGYEIALISASDRIKQLIEKYKRSDIE